MTNNKQIYRRVFAVILLALLLAELLLCTFGIHASAEGVSYTNVLTDLERDRNFDPSLYPEDPTKSEIKVIHIAEGDEGELYIYTYQPGNKVNHRKANYINISLQNPTINTTLTYKLYSLTWLNSDGVFDKYIVNRFTVDDATERFYNISAIYCPYDEKIDSSTSSEAVDTVQCRSFTVGQYWRTYYYNDVLMYESNRIDVVEYKVYATGTVRYSDGIDASHPFTLSMTDSHYAAFTITNFTVDQIIDADITYTLNTYSWAETYTPNKRTEELSKSVFIECDTITSKETASNDGSGWFGKKYTWNRIMDVETFKSISRANTNVDYPNEDCFDSVELEGLNSSQFVFAFAETPWSTTYGSTSEFGYYTLAENFGILRLKFISKNKTYNLGAVGDLVGTDSEADVTVDTLDNIINTIEEQEWWQKLMMMISLVLVVALLTFLGGPISFIFKIIATGVISFVKIVVYILTLPFRLLFGRRR